MVGLRDAGAGVIAVCRPRSPAAAYLRGAGIPCRELPGPGKLSWSSVRYLRRLSGEEGIDAVHVHYHSDIWTASLALRNDASRRLFAGIYMGVVAKNDPLHRWIYRRVDGFFTSSTALNERLPALYPVPASKIHLLPYGRNLDAYRKNDAKRRELRERYGIPAGAPVVGTMVRIDPGKGVLDFARSFPYLDPDLRDSVRYLIVGEPTRKGRVREGESPFEPACVAYLAEIKAFLASEKLGDRIILTGFQEDVAGHLGAMDVFAFPSRDELFSLVVLDAMAMSLPVVAAKAGGNVLQIAGGSNGLLYPVGDSRAMAGAIAEYLRDPGLRDRHGRNAREFVERHHDMRTTVRRLLDFYEQPRSPGSTL
jgi:glycosyltransferase involved in cell wall biosynthesis